MSHNVAQHNRHYHNRGALAASLASQHIAQMYRLEVRSAAGTLVASLISWSAAKWKATANEHGDLTLEYPYSADNWAFFAYPRQIWLRDDRGTLLERFHIVKRRRMHTLDGKLMIRVEGRSLIYQLSREVIDNYFAGNESQTVTLAGSPTGGTFTLSFDGQVTGNLAYNAAAATIQSALEGLSTIGSGNVTVTGSGPWTVEFKGTLAETDVARIRANGTNLTGGSTRITVTDTRATKTVSDVVKELLNNKQVNSTKIHFGYVESSIGSETIALKIENKSIMAALVELRERFGGYQYVDPANGRFYWKRQQGLRSGQYVRVGFNGTGIDEEEDFSALSTRLTAIGRGESIESTLTVTVNDSAAQSTYGIVPEVAVNKNIWNTDDLTDFANALLDTKSVPRKTWDVGVIDLARLTSADYSFHDFRVGSAIRVMDTTLGLTINTTIASIERDLDSPLSVSVGTGQGPLKVRIWVTNPEAGRWDGNEPSVIPAEERDVTHTLADVIRALMEEKLQDTGFEASVQDAIESIFQQVSNSSQIVQNITEIINEAIANDAVDVPNPGSGIQTIGTANAAGSSDDYARVDHVHKGNHFSAADKASLPSESDGADAHTTGSSTKRAYVRINSAWECLTHLE